MNRLVIVLTSLLLPVASSAADLPQIASSPRLHAVYAVQREHVTDSWSLWREPGRIETCSAALQRSEIWSWDDALGPVAQRFHHPSAAYIEYHPGQLTTLHALPAYVDLATIVSPQRLSGLRKTGFVRLDGRRAVAYRGRLNGAAVHLDWLEREQLPARVVLRSSQGVTRFTLVSVDAPAPTGCARVTADRINRYQRIDAADLGDREEDPAVISMMGAPDHAH